VATTALADTEKKSTPTAESRVAASTVLFLLGVGMPLLLTLGDALGVRDGDTDTILGEKMEKLPENVSVIGVAAAACASPLET